jgi:hypothetical protein
MNPQLQMYEDDFTAQVVAHFEEYLAPTINFVAELKRLGRWDDRWVVDPVRVTPWGTPRRPHFFEQDLTVTLTAPWERNAEIYYTLDETEATAQSLRYSKPLKIPPGSLRLSLNTTDASDGNREDLADWVNAGFTLK